MKDIANLLLPSSDTQGAYNRDYPPEIDLKAIKRTINMIPGTLPLTELLRQFQQSQVHMAAAINEHGTLLGIVTLEDVIEVLVGEINDEFDEGAPPLIQKIEKGYRVLSRVPLHQLATELDLPELYQSKAST